MIKKCIPTEWKQRVKHYDSLITKVKTSLDILMSGPQSFHELNNNDFYNIFKKQVLEKPYIHAFWSNTFEVAINWSVLYHSFRFSCPDNRIKAFKYKLIHNIIPTRENLHKWRILDSPESLHCNTKDNYLHFFISC